MAEILDESYGVADAQRERRRRRRVIAVLVVAIIATVSYFEFRTHSQEKVMAQFLQALQDKRYPDAHKMWGENKRYR